MAANEATKPSEVQLPTPATPAPMVAPQTIVTQQQAAFAQLTQIQAYVPAHVWTTEALLDYHQKLRDVIMDNNTTAEAQRKREHSLAKIVLAGFAAILAVGFWFAYLRIDLGRDIVIAAVSAGLGYVAGYGAGITKQRQ